MEAQPPPSERRGDLTRRSIFAAAEEAFGRLGYHGASIDAITQAAGVGLGTFYLCFPSKLAVFTVVARVRRQQWIQETARARKDAPDERVAAERGLRAYFTWIADRPHLLRLFREAEFVDPGLLSEIYIDPAKGLADDLASAMKAGIISHGDPDLLAWCVVALAEFGTLASLTWQLEKMDRQRVDAFMDFVIRMVGLASA